MNILTIADPHGSDKAFDVIKKKAGKADLIFVAGDITIFGMNMNKILHKINSWNKPTFIIPGNHEYGPKLKKQATKFENIIYLNKKAFEISNYFFLAIEGSGFAQRDIEFELIAYSYLEHIKKRRKEFTKYDIPFRYILMTHAPPYKTKCDTLWGGEHCGNKSIREFIRRSKPDIAICGHIHECFNTEDHIGNTLVVNPSIYGRMFNI